MIISHYCAVTLKLAFHCLPSPLLTGSEKMLKGRDPIS